MATKHILDSIAIVSTPGVLGGKPRIDGTRMSVMDIAVCHRHDWSVEEICEAFKLTPAQVYAALSYYYNHRAEIDEALEGRAQFIEQLDRERRDFAGTDDVLKAVMTPPAVAKMYNLSPRTVVEAIEHGWIEALKSGGTWLIRRADAEARWGDRKAE